MRIAKKVLAIVLAIVMVVGSFVIATSAADDGKIYVTLKAQVMTGTGASESVTLGVEDSCPASVRNNQISKQRADVTTYTGSKASLAYQDGSAVIEVNPGDMIWVTTSLESTGGIYPDAIQGQVFYDTGLFTSVAMQVAQCFQWDATNSIGKYTNTTLSGGTVWGRVANDVRQTYSAFTGDEADKYHYYHWYAAVDPTAVMNDMEIVEAQNGNLVTIPVYVRPDAKPGTTGTIFTVAHDKLKGSALPASDYSGDAGDIYETPYSIPSSAWDVSAATLTFKVAGGEAELDYTELKAQIADYEGRDADAYTTETWADATTAFNAAKALVDAAESQDDIDAAATALKNALAALEAKPVLDYTGINTAIASVPADLSAYTTSTATAVSTAKATAESVKVSATTQAELDNAAKALNSAVAALAQKANFENLNNALAEATGIANEGYTADSWSRLENAIAAAQAFDQDETAIAAQAQVNAAYDELVAAIDGLEKEVILDYTKWNAAVANIPADLSGYTPASVSAYETAKAAADSAYDAAVAAKDQAALDNAAEALQAAIDSLVAVANKAALKAAIVDAPEYAADMYSNWDAYATALATAQDVDADANATQAAVDAATDALVAAKAALTVAPADYSAVKAAKESVPADLSGYTADSAKAVNDAVAAVVEGKLKTEQEAVDAMAQAIVDAVAALEALANYEAVEAAKASVPADLSIYTDDSVKAVNDAVAAVVYGLGETKQADVNAMADAINTAVAGLVEKDADYTAVKAAKEEAANVNRDLYTASSLADLDYAVNAVVEGKKISAQAEVDAMADAITAAINALVLKPTDGHAKEVVFTDVACSGNTFTIKVDCRANKVRFVDTNNTDLTVTYSREAARANGTIVSYNAADEVVNDLSRDIAYEIWTINVSFQPSTYYVNVKDNDGWEDLDISYVVEYKYSTDDKAVNSAEAEASEVTVGEMVNITVKTGADVVKVQTVSSGSVMTFANPTVADGVATFTVRARVYLVGENTISFNIKTADGWEAVDTTVVVNGVAAE